MLGLQRTHTQKKGKEKKSMLKAFAFVIVVAVLAATESVPDEGGIGDRLVKIGGLVLGRDWASGLVPYAIKAAHVAAEARECAEHVERRLGAGDLVSPAALAQVATAAATRAEAVASVGAALMPGDACRNTRELLQSMAADGGIDALMATVHRALCGLATDGAARGELKEFARFVIGSPQLEGWLIARLPPLPCGPCALYAPTSVTAAHFCVFMSLNSAFSIVAGARADPLSDGPQQPDPLAVQLLNATLEAYGPFRDSLLADSDWLWDDVEFFQSFCPHTDSR
jgi:hypothetical protein